MYASSTIVFVSSADNVPPAEVLVGEVDDEHAARVSATLIETTAVRGAASTRALRHGHVRYLRCVGDLTVTHTGVLLTLQDKSWTSQDTGGLANNSADAGDHIVVTGVGAVTFTGLPLQRHLRATREHRVVQHDCFGHGVLGMSEDDLSGDLVAGVDVLEDGLAPDPSTSPSSAADTSGSCSRPSVSMSLVARREALTLAADVLHRDGHDDELPLCLLRHDGFSEMTAPASTF